MEENIFLQEYFKARKYIKYVNSTTLVASQKSNGMSEENIKNITKCDSNYEPAFTDHHLLLDITFNGHCLVKIE